jgi:hypothetical protein
MHLNYVIRWDDVYLTEFTDEPWWGFRDESKRFTRDDARITARRVRRVLGSEADVAVVRLVKKRRVA